MTAFLKYKIMSFFVLVVLLLAMLQLKNSVIGANSTVISDIPSNAIVVGFPVEVIRSDTNHVRNERN